MMNNQEFTKGGGGGDVGKTRNEQKTYSMRLRDN